MLNRKDGGNLFISNNFSGVSVVYTSWRYGSQFLWNPNCN